MGNMTTHTPAQLLRDLINSRLVSNELQGWSIFIGKLPSTPDQAISIIDQGGPAAFPHMLTDWPGIQILVRSAAGGTGYQSSYLITRLLRDTILGHPGHPVQFPELTSVTERGHIVPLGYDDRDRHTWSSNYQLIVEPPANALTYRQAI